MSTEQSQPPSNEVKNKKYLIHPDEEAGFLQLQPEVWETVAGQPRMTPIIERLTIRFGLNPLDAEDATQEALTNIYIQIKNGNFDSQKGSLNRWVATIFLNAAHDKVRRNETLMNRITPIGTAQRFLLSPAPSVEQAAIAREGVQTVVRALGTLNPLDRTVLELKLIQDQSYQEIEKATGLKPSTVAMRIQRAKKKLAQQLNRREGNAAD